MGKFIEPQKIESLKEARLWDINWSRETFPGAEWFFYVLEKQPEGGYLVHGLEYTADAAFDLRRELATDTGKKLFLRAKRRAAEMAQRFDDDSDAAYDACRDYYAEGRSVQEVPMSLRPAFKAFLQSKGRSAR